MNELDQKKRYTLEKILNNMSRKYLVPDLHSFTAECRGEGGASLYVEAVSKESFDISVTPFDASKSHWRICHRLKEAVDKLMELGIDIETIEV